MGSIVIKLPMPPGVPSHLVGAGRALQGSLLQRIPRYYKTSDAGYKDEDGYVYVMGRTDDIINVAGTGSPPAVWRKSWPRIPTSPNARCSASRTPSRARRPCGFVVLKAGVTRGNARSKRKSWHWCREKLGPVAAFKLAITVARLPKTAQEKSCAAPSRDRRCDQWTMPATIEDPKVLEEIQGALKGRV